MSEPDPYVHLYGNVQRDETRPRPTPPEARLPHTEFVCLYCQGYMARKSCECGDPYVPDGAA